jgi:hypothetical protein
MEKIKNFENKFGYSISLTINRGGITQSLKFTRRVHSNRITQRKRFYIHY